MSCLASNSFFAFILDKDKAEILVVGTSLNLLVFEGFSTIGFKLSAFTTSSFTD